MHEDKNKNCEDLNNEKFGRDLMILEMAIPTKRP
jgi:hypothetical protein